MPDRLRLQVWTPLPPQRTGVADHNMVLLEELAKLADVGVVVEDDLATDVLPPPGTVAVPRSQVGRHPAQLAVYHMGNHHGLHRGIYDALLRRPGLVVLHDPSLVDFYAAYHEGSPHGFDDEVTLNHGPFGDPPPRVTVGVHRHLDRLALQLVRRVVDASLAVVVHSAWARDALARQFPHKPVHHIDLAAPVVPDRPAGPDIRNRCGWGPDHVVFGMLGGVWAHKRPELAMKTFAALRPLRPSARLLVAGRAEDRDAMTRMLDVVSDARLEPAVAVLTEIDDEEFNACVSACDVVVDLRWPTAGETSATVMRAFGAGRPAIVSDLPQYGALDNRFCWRVPTHPPDAAAAALEVMLDVARTPARARHAGRLARRFVEETASFERVARRYEEVAREVVARGEAAPATTRPPGPVDRPSLRVAVHGNGPSGEPRRLTMRALDAAGVPAAPGGEQGSPTRDKEEVGLWILGDGEGTIAGRGGVTVAAWRGDDPNWSRVAESVARADEIWVPSRFLQKVATDGGATRVAVVPGVVEAPLPPGSSRADHDLPHGAVVFVAGVEAGWPVELQNPSAVVDAFARAFAPAERGTRAHLVVLAEERVDGAACSRLRDALDAVSGDLVVRKDGWDDAQARGLVGAADVYVSLHRATGFGVAMAEAMYLGRPVIATGFSGNLDFMTPANSCLVGYSLPSGGRGPGWAEPDLDQAARWMRALSDRPERRRALSAAAAAAIRSSYGVEAVGRAMAARLQTLG